MSDSFRLGLVGLGRWGRNVARTAAALPEVTLAAVASSNAEAAILAPGATLYASWQELVADPTLDGIYVASPTATHAEIALAALDAGRPVLLEKPMSRTIAEAERIAAAAHAVSRQVTVDFIHLFNPAYRALKAALPELGPIRSVHLDSGNWGPFRADTRALWDYGSHDIALACDLVPGKPRIAGADLTRAETTPEGRGEMLRFELAFPGGVVAQIATGNLSDRKRRRLEVRCRMGWAVFDDVDAPALRIAHADGRTETPTLPPDPPLARAIRDFAAAARGSEPDWTTLELGVKVTQILAAAELAMPEEIA